MQRTTRNEIKFHMSQNEDLNLKTMFKTGVNEWDFYDTGQYSCNDAGYIKNTRSNSAGTN